MASEQLQTYFVGVKGVVVDDDRILLLKKSGERAFWDVPGGRINRDEKVAETLERELREELPSITKIKQGSLLAAHVLDRMIADDVGLTLLFYKVEAEFDGEITLSSEHTEARWMTFDEARELGSEGIAAVVNELSCS